mgnify:FL=1|tara:strand:- start:19 stop:552 length:534 start_codon:yes stop_codon:yes gene_type:complete
MPTKNFSSIGGFAVGSTEVVNTEFELKNISAIHMVSDNFADATHDKYLVKRVTDAANNTLQLTLDSSTALATNSPALAADRVSFVKARVFGQETTSNQYVYATTFDIVVTTANDGTPTIASSYENIIRNNPPGQEVWNVTPDAFQIGGAPFFTFEVKSVTTNSTVKWIGVLDITVVS